MSLLWLCHAPRTTRSCPRITGIRSTAASQAILNGVTLVTPDAAIALHPVPILW